MSAYTANRSSIPGWGADLKPKDRPGSRREANRENVLSPRGDDYEAIERQIPKVEILVSSEHKKITPVFGTTCPPSGLSGSIRRLAFRFSEGRKSHWILLIFADRVNILESAAVGLLKGRSHNPLREMGWKTELERGAFRSRFGRNRADMKRWGQEAALAGAFMGAVLVERGMKRRRRLRAA